MNGLNALFWVCAAGLAVFIVCCIVQMIQNFRGRGRSAIEKMMLLDIKLRQDIDELRQEVDELKKKQQ